MSDYENNPKMQPTIKQKFRAWQFPNAGDYHYGECPNCGGAGNSEVEDQDEEYFKCEDCGCEYIYETTYAYRYAGIDPDWTPDVDAPEGSET